MIDKKLLTQCKEDYDTKLITYNKMQNYYDGLTDALENYQMVTNRANNKVSHNMIQKFVIEEASYVCGNKITYSSFSANKNVIEDIRVSTAHWSEKHDKNVCKQGLIFSESYELIYTSEIDGLIHSMVCTPKDSYLLQDDFGNVTLFIRFYQKQFNTEDVFADVYDIEGVNHYIVDGTDFTIDSTIPAKPNIFSKVPVAPCNMGSIYESIYNNIKGAQDGYETVESDIINEISDFRNAYLKLTGTVLGHTTEEAQIAADLMKEKGIWELPVGGDAQWVIKNLNDTFVQNTLNTLKENMYELTSHINHNDKLASNTSSLALRNRLIGLEQKCVNNVQAMQDSIKIRLGFIFEYLQITQKKEYFVSDIDIKLTVMIPTDDLMMAQILSQYPISKKTGLKQFSFITDSEAEIKQLEEESKADSIGNDLLSGDNNADKQTI